MRKTAILLMICLAVAGCLHKTGKRHYRYGDALNVFTDPGKQYAALYHDSALYCRASSGVTPGFYAAEGSVYREWRSDEREDSTECFRK